MTIVWNGRIFNAIADEGQPFGLVWDGQIYDLDLFVIPKGSPNKEAALDFVRYSTATKPLADQASWIPYGPVRASSIPLVGTFHSDASLQMIDHMPTTAEALKNDAWHDVHQRHQNSVATCWGTLDFSGGSNCCCDTVLVL